MSLPPVPPGGTPIDADEAQGLLPSHITTQEQLNEWEAANVQDALGWVRRSVLSRTKRGRHEDVLSEPFIRTLHRHMFDRTWQWAGTFRKSEKNIGVAPERIAVDLRNILDDARYWIENKTYSVDEIAARFHHRLVHIHPFANGNGRLARLATDVLLERLEERPFTWGSGADLVAAGGARERYLDSLRSADAGKYESLLAFVRS